MGQRGSDLPSCALAIGDHGKFRNTVSGGSGAVHRGGSDFFEFELRAGLQTYDYGVGSGRWLRLIRLATYPTEREARRLSCAHFLTS